MGLIMLIMTTTTRAITHGESTGSAAESVEMIERSVTKFGSSEMKCPHVIRNFRARKDKNGRRLTMNPNLARDYA
jgi:hypothetical protein